MRTIAQLIIQPILMTMMMSSVQAWGRAMADLAVYDFAASNAVNIASNKFREIVISSNPTQSNFFTITRVGLQKLAVRERNNNGAIVSAAELPFFVSGYAGHNWIRLSPNHAQAVFYNETTKGLSLVSLADQRQSDLVTNIFNSSVDLALLNWFLPDSILALRSATPTRGIDPSGILKININSGATETWPRPLTFGGGHALSQSGMLLAVKEGMLGDRVTILDVATMKTYVELPTTKSKGIIGSLYWFDADRRLAFEKAGGGITYYHLDTGNMQEITPEGNEKYRLKGATGQYVVLEKKALLGRYEFILHNVVTGNREPLTADINGEVYGIATNKLVMEVGY